MGAHVTIDWAAFSPWTALAGGAINPAMNAARQTASGSVDLSTATVGGTE